MGITYGTRAEGDRLVLMTEALFVELVEAFRESSGKDVTVEWGDPITATHTYYEPSVWEDEPEDEPEA